jgi:hypothetical protein
VKRALSVYPRILRTYAAWSGILLPLAIVVLVPLGLIHAVPIHADVTSLGSIESIEVLVVVAAVAVLATTGLIGEVFYTGAVSIALTRRRDGRKVTLRQVAAMVNYPNLIAIDLAFGVMVALGLVALVVPGVLAFVYLGLAAPVAEIEHRGFRGAFARSLSLVRGHFWLVFWVLVPIEVASGALTKLATSLSEGLFSNSLLIEWTTDTLSNIVLTPFSAVAAVLLTLDLIADMEGDAPPLHSTPPPG